MWLLISISLNDDWILIFGQKTFWQLSSIFLKDSRRVDLCVGVQQFYF